MFVFLPGCSAPGDAVVADYTLELQPVVASNQSPFEGLDGIDLVLRPAAGEETRVPLGDLASGSTAVADGLPALDETEVHVEGHFEGSVVTWGRSEPLTASTGAVSSAVFVASVDRPAWLGPLVNPLAGPLVAALGGGRFLVGGGRLEEEGVLSQANESVGFLSLAPADPTLTFVETDTLPTYTDAYDGDTLRARVGASMTGIEVGENAGRFLVVGGSSGGGFDHGGDITRAVTLYDPGTNTWSELPESDALETPRSEHLAATNTQGGVVVAGGWTTPETRDFAWTSSIEIWDPSADGFSLVLDDATLGSLDLVSADLGVDGLLVCGGAVFETVDGDWVSSERCTRVGLDGVAHEGPDLPAALAGAAMANLADGRILLTGGALQLDRAGLDDYPGPAARTSAWYYNPARPQDGWVSLSPMNLPRAGHRMAPLSDGRVVVAGGAPTYSPVRIPADAYSCVELFDPDTNRFELVDECSVEDAAGGLAGRAWKPAVAVDPEFGAVFVGGASATADEEAAASQVTLFVPEPR